LEEVGDTWTCLHPSVGHAQRSESLFLSLVIMFFELDASGNPTVCCQLQPPFPTANMNICSHHQVRSVSSFFIESILSFNSLQYTTFETSPLKHILFYRTSQALPNRRMQQLC
jgi:hypothetical protein